MAAKNPQQNAIRADKSTNTNIVADELCQQIENGFARISITDDCEKIDEKNNLCVPQMQNKGVKNNRNQNSYIQQQKTCNDSFQNLRIQCMCCSGGVGDEEICHCNADVEHVKTAMCCTCSCTQNSVHDKYSRFIIDSGGGNGGGSDDCCGVGGKFGTAEQQHREPPLLPLPTTEKDQFNKTFCVNCVNNRRETFDDDKRTNTCKEQQNRCNINLTEFQQCDDSLKATNNQLAMVHLNNLSHNNVYSHLGAPHHLDSLTKESTTQRAVTNVVSTTRDDFCNAIAGSNLHSSCSISNQAAPQNPNKMGKNVLNLAESIEMSDDGVPMTPSPTLSNISCSLNIASGSISAAVTVGIEERAASASMVFQPAACVHPPVSSSPLSTQTKLEIDKNLLTQNDSGDFGSSNSAATTTVTSSSSTISSATATPIPSQILDDIGSVNVAKRKKQPETKLVLDLNDRSKYTKEVSV